MDSVSVGANEPMSFSEEGVVTQISAFASLLGREQSSSVSLTAPASVRQKRQLSLRVGFNFSLPRSDLLVW